MDADPIEGNRALWDELTPIHAGSAFYDVEGFKRGRSTLSDIELDELGPEVAGKRLLHLQCHFGLDTLSLARMGAVVTGVDLSPRSVELARALAGEVRVPAEFVQADVYELPSRLDARFDVVFTSWGVISWLPDLGRWAEVIAGCLEPGGVFYMAEFHPILRPFGNGPEPELVDSYFFRPEPKEWKLEGTYVDPSARVEGRSYQWDHPLGEIVTALVDAGLRIEFLHEHARCPERIRSWLSGGDDGWWSRPGDPLPLSFSLKARRP